MKYKIYSREFKNIDTEQKAYFLGLLYADGCLSDKKGNSLHMRISLADKQLIDDLFILFPFLNYGKFDFGKYNKKSVVQYALRKTCKEMGIDLLSHGLLPRKSTENKDLLSIPILDKELYRHFLRGFFDGDGSINISKQRPNLRRAEICCVAKNFLLQIETLFKESNIINKNLREKKIGSKSISPLFVIEWINSDSILKLRDFFYKDATIFLKRKKEKFDSFKIIHIKDSNPDCPLCKKQGVCSKRGTRQMEYGLAYRFFCHDCNKRFTLKEAQLKSEELLENPEMDNQQPSL